MSSRSEKNKNALRDRHQSILSEMLKEDANRLCADCNAKGPRWASWNIGVFLCIRCAGIHRNLGVHISKVKSVNLDSWTPEQMDHIVQWGNQRCKDVYECYLPKDFCRPQGDSAMETFIRSKYERKLYIIKGDISTAGLNPNRSIVNQPKQDDKPKVSSTNKVERPSKALQDQKTKSRSKPMVSLESPSTSPVVAPSVSKTTSSSVDDLLSMGDFQGANNSGPANNSQTSDLFGLDSSSGNGFHTQTTQQQSNGASAQDPFSTNGNVTTEQDLFPDDSTAQPAKSAKDTIMSLYATGRSQPSSNAMYGIPGGVYMANGTANNSQGAYNNHQQYQNQPQFHGNSHFTSSSQGQMMMPQQQPLHQQMQQMSMNQGQMAFNSNQQYPNHANLPGNQYQQPRPMTMPMYSQNMNNARPMGGHQMGMVQANWAMPSNQQPILANGNPNVLAPSGMTQNTMGHGNMGHTLSTQLWN